MHYTRHESGIRIHEAPWLTAVFAPLGGAYLAFALWDLHRLSELGTIRGVVLGTGALAFVWAMATLQLVSIIHFDRESKSVRWRRLTLLRREQGEVPFDQIERLALTETGDGRSATQRLVVVARSGEKLTVLPRFNPELERDLDLFSELRALLAAPETWRC